MTRLIAVLSTMVILLAACGGIGGGTSKADIRIGSDDFYESKLMAEIYAQILENDGYKVTRNLGLGARPARAPAFEEGQVDLVPEYVGSGLGHYDKTKTTGDGEANKAALQAILDTKGADGGKLASVLAITAGQDTNAAVVRKDTAESLGLAKMSDLAAVQDQLRWGLPPDCDKNPLCKGALEQYGITYPPKQRTEPAACDAPIEDIEAAPTQAEVLRRTICCADIEERLARER
jgi:osmoprotectant transport system substrate-binding protein